MNIEWVEHLVFEATSVFNKKIKDLLKMVAGFCVLAVITHYTERAPAEGPWLFLLPHSATPAMSLLMLWVFQALTILVISWETRTAKGYATQLDI